jgi:predicted transcriptional regulator of viral defense system
MKTSAAFEQLGTFTAEQWGLVTSKQASRLGVNTVTLYRLKEAGFLETVRRGVYAATTATTTEAREEQAAWLSLRPEVPGWERDPHDASDGVMSHNTAARLHGLGELTNGEIAMTTPRRRTSRDPDLRFKIGRLEADDVMLIDGLPVTTVLRTVCDLLDQHIDASHVATIIRQAVLADQLRLDDLTERIAPYARRYRVRPDDGAALLEHLLEQIGMTATDLVIRPAPPQFQLAAAAQAIKGLMMATGSGNTFSILHIINELGKENELATPFNETLSKLNQVLGGSGLAQLTAAISESSPQVRKQLAAGLSNLAIDAAGPRVVPDNVAQTLTAGRLTTNEPPRKAQEQHDRDEETGRDDSTNPGD